jgi:hypothetical protein
MLLRYWPPRAVFSIVYIIIYTYGEHCTDGSNVTIYLLGQMQRLHLTDRLTNTCYDNILTRCIINIYLLRGVLIKRYTKRISS